jgi:hypothetical protein
VLKSTSHFHLIAWKGQAVPGRRRLRLIVSPSHVFAIATERGAAAGSAACLPPPSDGKTAGNNPAVM